MRLPKRDRVVLPALEDVETGIHLENSSIAMETGSSFKDNSFVTQAVPSAGSGDDGRRERASKEIPSELSSYTLSEHSASALSTYNLSKLNGRTSMFLHWLGEDSHESGVVWLVRALYGAEGHGNTGDTHQKSIGSAIEDLEATFYRGVVHRESNRSTKSMVDTTLQAESLPSLSDGSSCGDNKQIEEDILDALIQRLYRNLYFKNAGSYSQCANNNSGKGTPSPKTNTASQQPGQKRARAGSSEPAPDDDQDGKSGRVMTAKKCRPNLEEFTTKFACVLCKGNIDFGYERGCRDWKNESIDTVLRRHLNTHVDMHISRADFERVQAKELKRKFAFAATGKDEDLWVAAFMVLFNIPETDRHRVPSPYWSTQDDVRNSLPYPTFYANMRQRISHDRAVAFEVAQYFRENDALAARRRERKEELVREYRETGQMRVEQAQRQTNDEFQTAVQNMDLEFNRQQVILDERFRMRWDVHHCHTPTQLQPTPLPDRVPTLPQQAPPATTRSFLSQSIQDNNNNTFEGLTQTPNNTALDDMFRFESLPPSPPTPGDPIFRGTSAEVRPSSMSPSASELVDPAHDDSGIGMCDNALPCDKDYVCDYHKLFHTPVV